MPKKCGEGNGEIRASGGRILGRSLAEPLENGKIWHIRAGGGNFYL